MYVLCLSVCVAGTRPKHVTESVWSSPTHRSSSFQCVCLCLSLVLCFVSLLCVWLCMGALLLSNYFLSLSCSAHSVRRAIHLTKGGTVPTIRSYIDTSFLLSLVVVFRHLSFFLALFSISLSISLFSLCSIRIPFVLTLLNRLHELYHHASPFFPPGPPALIEASEWVNTN